MSETSSENKKVSKSKMLTTMIQSKGTFQNTEVRQFGTEWENGVAAEHGTVLECCWSSAWPGAALHLRGCRMEAQHHPGPGCRKALIGVFHFESCN